MPPSAITGLTSSSITSAGFTVSWSGGNGATSYTYTIDGAAATPSANNGVASKSATFSGLSSNTSYTVVVTAVNVSGNAVSNQSTVTTQESVPINPGWSPSTNVTITGNNTIQKTGGVNGNEDAGSSSYINFTYPQVITFSASSSIQAAVGLGGNSGYDTSNERVYSIFWRLMPNGQFEIFDLYIYTGWATGTYTSQTVFKIALDISNPSIRYMVFYKDNVEVVRVNTNNYPINYFNVSINTSGGTINNITLMS
jgi:hypothetical protein